MTRREKASDTMHEQWKKFRQPDNHDHQHEKNKSQSEISQ